MTDTDIDCISLIVYRISVVWQEPKRQNGLSDLKFLETFTNPYVKVCVFCKVCDKKQSLKHQSSWKRHFLTHSSVEDRPFKCEHCNRGFVQSGNLKLHIQKVHGHKSVMKAENENVFSQNFVEKQDPWLNGWMIFYLPLAVFCIIKDGFLFIFWTFKECEVVL